MKSPNQIIIDGIKNEDIISFHKAVELLRKRFDLRIRIKEDGRSSRRMYLLPHFDECGY